MKKYFLFLAVFMVILSLVSCSFEPIVTTIKSLEIRGFQGDFYFRQMQL